MREGIRTFLAVAVLTTTIWIWADLEQQETVPVLVQVQVRPENRPPDIVVESIEPDRIKVLVTGHKGDLQRIQTPKMRVCNLEVSEAEYDAAEDGRLKIPVPANGFDHWRESGVTPEQARTPEGEPVETITLVLDRKVRKEIEVRPRVTGATVRGEPTARPSRVTATVEERDWRALPPAERYAEAVVNVTPPIPETVEREVRLRKLGGPNGIDAEFEPVRVRVTAELESEIQVVTLEQVPLVVSGPPEKLNAYRIYFQEDPPQLSLTIQGPPGPVSELTQDPDRPRLVLRLTRADKPAEPWNLRKPEIEALPPGVEVVGDLPDIVFNLEPLESAAP